MALVRTRFRFATGLALALVAAPPARGRSEDEGLRLSSRDFVLQVDAGVRRAVVVDDCDGDGVPDVVCGEERTDDFETRIVLVSGRTGKRLRELWAREWRWEWRSRGVRRVLRTVRQEPVCWDTGDLTADGIPDVVLDYRQTTGSLSSDFHSARSPRDTRVASS